MSTKINSEPSIWGWQKGVTPICSDLFRFVLGMPRPGTERSRALRARNPKRVRKESVWGRMPRTPFRSRSPKAGHNKAGRSDFRNQRFEADTGKMRKMRKVPLTPEKQGSEEIPPSKNAKNAENAENADTKTRKMRMTGFNVTGN